MSKKKIIQTERNEYITFNFEVNNNNKKQVDHAEIQFKERNL